MSRIVLWAALVGGISYIASWFLDIPPGWSTAWKGTGVGLLALYAALNARSPNGWLLTAVMIFGCLGDVLLETHGLIAGALAFLAGHLTAIWLYLKNRRAQTAPRHWAIAALLFVVITGVAFLLPPDRAGAPGIALYAAGLAAMTGAAFVSRFPRALVFAGALMFAVSDLLIFLRTGRPALDTFPMGLGVWGLYFAGQALIAVGVVRTLGGKPVTNG